MGDLPIVERLRVLAKPRNLILSYAIVAIVTFGIVASDGRRTCWRTETGERVNCPSVTHAGMGFVAGIAWPLYWSWAGAEAARSEEMKK